MFEESVSEAWSKRFGSVAPLDSEVLAHFLAHRSVRRFTDEAIPDENVVGLIAAAQSAATSSNLQSWSVISVQDAEARLAVAAACDGQKQIVTAPLFLAFVADLNRIYQFAVRHGIEPDGLDTAEMYTVAVIDAALAAERLVCAAEALGYGICYIGALRNDPVRIKELLGLPSRVFGVFGLCVGVPLSPSRASIKPRLDMSQVWFKERYPESLDSAEYDARMDEFHVAQGMASDVSWSEKSARRVLTSGLSGREGLLEFLREQGFLRR